MTKIELYTRDREIYATSTPKIASGDRNSLRLKVVFDECWNDYAKTAVFYRSDNSVAWESLLVGNECYVPSEVLADNGWIYIGIRGVKSGTGAVKTSMLIRYKVEKGANGNYTYQPSPEIYQQILTAYSDMKNDLAVERARIDSLSRLENGSTTGDAELADIRVDADGNIYETAGDAVRGQIAEERKRLSTTAVFINGTPSVVYDSTNTRTVSVTFPEKVHVYCNSKRYELSPCTVTADLSVTLEGTDIVGIASLFEVVFCTDTNSAQIVYAGRIPENAVLIGTVYKDTFTPSTDAGNETNFYPDSLKPMFVHCYSGGYISSERSDTGYTIHFSLETFIYYNRQVFILSAGRHEVTFPSNQTTVNLHFLLFDLQTCEISLSGHRYKIPMNKVVIGYVHRLDGVHLFNDISKYDFANNGLVPILYGVSGKYITVDSKSKTVTMPPDMLAVCSVNENVNFIQMTPLTGDPSEFVTLSYADFDSTALVCVFNVRTREFSLKKYSDKIYQNEWLIFTMRTTSGQLGCTVPYFWDGKFMGEIALGDDGNVQVDAVPVPDNCFIKSIEHRGHIQSLTENTLRAFRASKEAGFDYIECDVRFTSDSVPYLLHNETYTYTDTDGVSHECTLSQQTSAEIEAIRENAQSGVPEKSEPLLCLCRQLGLKLYLEIKDGSETAVRSLYELVRKYNMLPYTSFIGFSSLILEYVRTKNNEAVCPQKIRLGLVSNSWSDEILGRVVALADDNTEVFADLNYSAVSDSVIQACSDSNVPLEVWTITSADTLKSLITAYPYISGVTSNYIHAGRELCKAYI